MITQPSNAKHALPPLGIGMRKFVAIAVALWIAAVSLGFVYLLRYEGVAEQSALQVAAAGPSEFPENDLLTQNRAGKTLVMFAHPHCPCTHASLGELQLILSACPELKPVQIVFPLPAGANDSWQNGVIVQQAHELDGVEVKWDVDESLTKIFAAQNSGHVLLFDAHGKRLFSGGITALRGHPGWNSGRAAIVAIAQNNRGVRESTPIFGCPLRTESPCIAGAKP